MTESRFYFFKPLFDILFFAILASYCIWIFSLPLFPTQDGPVHLYYINVLHRLAEHSGLFTHYFAVKWPPPPYVVHYVLLFGLTEFLSPLLAEKLVVAACVLLFCLGARFLLQSVTGHYRFLSLFLLPLSLNWMIGMGFHNYCLSLGTSFFAMGCWIRIAQSRSPRRYQALFLGLVLLMLFTHPVPLMITLAVATGDLFLRAAADGRPGQGMDFRRIARALRPEIVLLLLAYCSLLYVALFVSKGRTHENLHYSLIQRDLLHDFAKARPLILVDGGVRGPIQRLWFFPLLAVMAAAGFAGLAQSLRFRQWTRANTFALGGLTVLAALPFIPRSINGSDFFADRLFIYAWIFSALGCSAVLRKMGRWFAPAAAVAAAISLGALAIDNGPIREIAKNLAQMEESGNRHPGSRGMFVDNPFVPLARTTFEPYTWTAARYFRVTNSIMMNAPWLDLPISPLIPRNDLFANLIPPDINNYPVRILEEMERSSSFRDLLTPRSDFVVLVGSVEAPTPAYTATFHQSWISSWSCEKEHWFSVCKHPQ